MPRSISCPLASSRILGSPPVPGSPAPSAPTPHTSNQIGISGQNLTLLMLHQNSARREISFRPEAVPLLSKDAEYTSEIKNYLVAVLYRTAQASYEMQCPPLCKVPMSCLRPSAYLQCRNCPFNITLFSKAPKGEIVNIPSLELLEEKRTPGGFKAAGVC